jgi:hypothetical protein
MYREQINKIQNQNKKKNLSKFLKLIKEVIYLVLYYFKSFSSLS